MFNMCVMQNSIIIYYLDNQELYVRDISAVDRRNLKKDDKVGQLVKIK